MAGPSAVSDTTARAGFVLLAGLFCLMFGGIGALVFYSATWPALRDYRAAGAWAPVPCVIEASEVESRQDSDGDTMYRAKIQYAYERDGRTHHGDRAALGNGWSNAYAGYKHLVEAHPAGSRTQCLVDPADPDNSVLERRLSHTLWGTGAFSLLFGGGGLAGLLLLPLAFLGGSRPRPSVAGASAPARSVELVSDSTAASRLGPLIVAGVWNGAVVLMAIPNIVLSEGQRIYVFFVFSPFLLVGFGLLWWAGREAMKTLNPRPRLRLEREPRVGERVHLYWSFSGRTWRLNTLSIALEGLERAKYRRGTDDYTDERVFLHEAVISLSGSGLAGDGSAPVSVPARGVPSFVAEHNEIVWRFVVRCEITAWPDIEERFPFTVHPSRGRA